MQYALVALWLAVYAGLAALGYPIVVRLFGRFSTRGVGFALPVALLAVWLPVYWLGKLAFGPLTVAVGFLVLVGLAAVTGLDREALRNREVRLAPALRAAVDDEARSAAVDTAVVFTAAFCLLIAVRAVDPTVHAIAGEKYLDFGLLKSILRTGTLPPTDMWFAGQPVNYYYGGHLLAAILTMATGTAPEFAYNLALAGFYAMLVTAAFDLAGTVAADRGGDRRTAGAFAAFFVGLASNLKTVGKLVAGYLPKGVRAGLVNPDARVPYYTLDTLDRFYYWWASRAIPGTINEFPLFSFLNGDLHAHMMGTPFLLLAAAVAYALYRAPAADRGRRWGLLGLLPALGLFQVVTDTWSFPSVFGLVWLGLTFAPAGPVTLFPEGLRPSVGDAGDGTDRLVAELRRPLLAAAVVVAVGVVTVVLALPFLTGAGAERSMDLLPAEARSGLGGLLIVHGAFVALFLGFLVSRLDDDRRWPLVLALVAVAAVAVTQSMAVLAIAAPLFVLGWVALRFDRPAGFETVLILAGAGLVTLVEFVYVVEKAGPLRMNTVFKTYIQVWVLWGTAAGIVAAELRRRPGFLPSVSPATRRTMVSGALALLVVSTSLYGALALSSHFAGASGGATLDATAFGKSPYGNYDSGEVRAVKWFDDEAGPDATLLSAPATGRYPGKGGGYPPGMYGWNSAIAASMTGVPTVVGWAHEVGYRGPEAYYPRVRAVDGAYTNASRTADVVREYDVEYVWVGTAERARYRSNLVDFREVPWLTPVYRNETVVVYRVNEDELPD